MTCGSCGRENPEGARFCNGCGAPLAGTAPSREERKVVSVVFADLVGSTALAERSDPEDVRAMLASHYQRVRGELERFGGTVEKFIGDAVVAVFGAPVVHEDDPERAVRAALAIRDSAIEAGVELRIAVNTGEALVSVDARPGEGQSMVAGDVMNTAARIQAAAPVNGVLVGETTYRATAHVFEYRAAPAVDAKGKVAPVPVWEAIVPRSRVAQPDAPQSPLIGRQQEAHVLRDALARARAAREPQLVTVVGVPGIGKSRLVAELFSMIEADPELVYWRQGRCLPYGEGVSYWALGEMAKAQAGILESDTADVADAKLTSALATLVPDPIEAAWVTGHLRQLVGLSTDAGVSAQGRGETFAAWRRLFEAMAEQRPTVLLFEDLHWADDGLLDFIDNLVDRATGVPLMVLCTARPELLVRRPGWGGGKANAATLSLAALSTDETARLIAAHLEDAVLPAEVHRTLLQRADGNPLFAEEYIRMLRDRGHLRFDGRRWRVEEADIELPETVQGIIAARLDALAPAEKTVLQTASVVGKVFWLGSVAAMAGATDWDTEEHLHALERKELVRRDRRGSVAGEAEYAVRHVLVRDVAYGQIPRARRAELHLRAVEWIDSLPADRAEDRSEMRAHHYEAALELLRAAGGDTGPIEGLARLAFREAGRHAYALSALGSAVSFLRRARELWPQDDPEYPQLLWELGDALFWARNEGDAELEEASRLLLAAGQVERAAEAESRLGWLCWVTGRRGEAATHSQRAVELIEGLPETRATTIIRAEAWRTQLLQGVPVSLPEGERIAALAERLGTLEDRFNTQLSLAIGYVTYGADRARGVRLCEQVLADALRANSFVAARAYINLATFVVWTGDLRRSAQLTREGLETARRFGSHTELWLTAELAQHEYLEGDWEAAHERATAFLARSGAANVMDTAAYSVLACIAAARGEWPVARTHAARLAEQALAIGDPQSVHPALATCAWLSLDGGDRTAAEEHLAASAAALVSLQHVDARTIEAAIVASALDKGGELAARLAPAAGESAWATAAIAILDGRLTEAAEILEETGYVTGAAVVRLVEAERAGHATPGLARAVEFFERVGATAWLDRAPAVGGVKEVG